MQILRAIMIGDVVGDPGLEALESKLPSLINEYSADFVTVNGENAAAGFGLTGVQLQRIFAAGADVVTGGNHIWEKREFWPVMETEERVLRPLNYTSGNPDQKTAGRGWLKLEKPSRWGTIQWVAVNLQGRDLMACFLDCPFKTFDEFCSNLYPSVSELHSIISLDAKLLEEMREKAIILVDFHAESSREKEALAYYLDGRVSVLAGTHTHVQTADERLLPKGTAYITDLGMTGILDGVIGMDTKICVERARSQVLYRMEVASPGGRTGVQGIMTEIDFETGKAVSVKRL